MKIILLLIIVLSLINCSNKEFNENINSEESKYSFENIVRYEDTVFLKSKFADCGEWGGHSEVIKIYRAEKKIELAYTKYKVSCDDRDINGSIIQVKDQTNSINLTHSQQISIMNYINNLMKLKFIDSEFGNSGNFFTVEDSRGT